MQFFELQMKYSTSREKLSQMHEALDRELEMAGHHPLTRSKRDKDELRYMSEQDEYKKSTLTNISNKPTVFEHQIRDIDIKTKKNQISELQRKLMELQKKMDNFSVSSDDEPQEIKVSTKQKLSFKPKIDTRPNEDTARFLVQMEEKQRLNSKFSAQNRAYADEDEEEEDSEQYFQVRQAIIKRKAEQRESNQRKSVERIRQKIPVNLSRDSRSKKIQSQDADRKISVQTEGILRPKYSNERSNRITNKDHKKSVSKGSIRQSIVSKKSVEKQKKLPRNSSKGSLKSEQSKKQAKKVTQGNDRSFDRSEAADELGLREQEMLLTKQIKKANNLQKELQHYKRLTKKLKQEVQSYKVMEIEFRELKKNFAKSEAIRVQQKKIIQTLKAKVGR